MDARRRNSLLECLERLRRVLPAANLMQLLAFLYICENEGINLAELAQVCRTTRATASRTARALAIARLRGALAGSVGLIDMHANPNWTYGRILHLSEAGRRLAADLDAIICDACPIAIVAPPHQASANAAPSLAVAR